MRNQGSPKRRDGVFPAWILRRSGAVAGLVLAVLVCSVAARCQSLAAAGGGTAATQEPDRPVRGKISGTIVDRTGVAVAGATVVLERDDIALRQETRTTDEGEFSFPNVGPGPFRLTISAEGFAAQTFSGELKAGEEEGLPRIVMPIATAVTEVVVTPPSQVEIAQEQLREEEHQRALGIIPNFYVTYHPDAEPLTPKQKFQLAWKSTVDPVNFGVTAAIAGIEQATRAFNGYGQGAAGYGRRYGAAYGNLVTGTLIGGAILPSLLKQDPRYFYKGTGSTRSRLLYAMANAVICKGDNGKWQTNYSAIVGSLASGGISNAYYAPQDRSGWGLTFENALIGIGASAATNILQEFVLKRLTPNTPNAPKGSNTISKVLGTVMRDGD